MHHAILAGVLAGVLAAGATGIAHVVGSDGWLTLGITVGIALGAMFVFIGLPWLGIRSISQLLYWRRLSMWKRHEGHHYSFGNITLGIEDDGRALWLPAADLQRVLRSNDKDEVVAARHAGRWRRDKRGRLQLRVDAVVQVLSTAPGRMDPHIIHLRRYLEREVLFPAKQRRSKNASVTMPRW